MKKILLLLTAIVCLGLSARANECTVTFNKLGYSDAQAITDVTTGDKNVSITCEQGSGTKVPEYKTSATALYLYNKNTMTVAVPAKGKITKITWTCTSSSYKVTGSVSAGTLTAAQTSTWAGSAESVTLTMNSSFGARITSMTVTYDAPPAAEVEPVEFTTVESKGAFTVTLSSPTSGAEIYYGFDMDDMSTKYEAPFTVDQKCTLYAIAYKNGVPSEPSSKVLRLSPRYTNFKDVLSAEANTDLWIVGNFQVVAAKSPYVLLTDGNTFMLLSSTETLNEGDKIEAVKGTATIEETNQLFTLVVSKIEKGGDGAEAVFDEIYSKEEINFEDNLFDGVILKGCNITQVYSNNTNATVKYGDQDFRLLNRYGLQLETGENFDIKGVVSRSSTTLYIVPIEITGGQPTAQMKTPLITPKKRELQHTDNVIITCANNNAQIYYTLDGTDPDETSELYNGPFTIDLTGVGVVSVKARAYDAADENKKTPSDVAEREYRLFDPTCNVINTKDHEHDPAVNPESHSCSIDNVDYVMNATHNDEYESLVVNGQTKTIYVIQTSKNEGYVLDSIEVDYDMLNTTSTGTVAQFAVVGSNEPLTQTNYQAAGEKVGTITKDAPSVTFDKDYKYFAIYTTSSRGNTYLNSITIHYREPNNEDAPELEDELEFTSDESGLTLPVLPEAANWSAKYSINGDEFDYADTENGLHVATLDPATTHEIEIWYEHDLNGSTTEHKKYFHLTAPQANVEKDEDEVIYIDFGTIGEGVEIYFTLDGSTPSTAQTVENPVEVKGMKFATATDGVYKVEEPEELAQTHNVSGETTMVEVHPSTLASNVSLRAQAVDAAHNLQSAVTTADDVQTGVATVASDQKVEMYTVDGVKVSGAVEEGIYIVVTGGKAQKVVIRR